MNRIASRLTASALALAGLALVWSAGPTSAQTPSAQTPSAQTPAPTKPATQATPSSDAGKALFESVCSNCHELSIATEQRKTRDEWATTVDNMIGHGAPLTGEQAGQIVDYLAKTYSPDSK